MAAVKPNPQNDGERLTAMEQAMCNVETKVDDLKTDIDGLRADFKDFIAAADNRYASKTVERVVYAAVGLVLSSVMLALLALVVARGA